MTEEKDLNPFGAALLQLLEARGMSLEDLAEIISARPEAPEISGEDITRIMTSEPGEEFMSLMNAFDEAVVKEN
jgi:hypothetical protein